MTDNLPNSLSNSLAQDIRSVADRARTEEDLRIGVEKLLLFSHLLGGWMRSTAKQLLNMNPLAN